MATSATAAAPGIATAARLGGTTAARLTAAACFAAAIARAVAAVMQPAKQMTTMATAAAVVAAATGIATAARLGGTTAAWRGGTARLTAASLLAAATRITTAPMMERLCIGGVQHPNGAGQHSRRQHNTTFHGRTPKQLLVDRHSIAPHAPAGMRFRRSSALACETPVSHLPSNSPPALAYRCWAQGCRGWIARPVARPMARYRSASTHRLARFHLSPTLQKFNSPQTPPMPALPQKISDNDYADRPAILTPSVNEEAPTSTRGRSVRPNGPVPARRDRRCRDCRPA